MTFKFFHVWCKYAAKTNLANSSDPAINQTANIAPENNAPKPVMEKKAPSEATPTDAITNPIVIHSETMTY